MIKYKQFHMQMYILYGSNSDFQETIKKKWQVSLCVMLNVSINVYVQKWQIFIMSDSH